VRRRSKWSGSNGASGALNVDGSPTMNSERCSTILPAQNLFLTRVHIQCVCHSVHRLFHQSKWTMVPPAEERKSRRKRRVNCTPISILSPTRPITKILSVRGCIYTWRVSRKKCKIHIDQISDVNGIAPRNVQLVIIGHSPHPHAKSHRSSLTHAAPPTAATSSLHPC